MTESFRIGPFRLSPHKRGGKLTGKWLVDVPAAFAGGKRKRKFFDNCKSATRFARELERHYRNGRLIVADETATEPVETFAVVAEDWLAFERLRVETGKKRQKSLDSDIYRLKALLQMFGNDPLGDITEERITLFQARRLKTGRKASTINSDIRTLMKICRWAHRKGRLDKLPEIEKIPENLPDTLLPTQQEVTQIISHLPERLQLLVRFISHTGCRSGEAFNLTWENVDLEEGYVAFKPNGQWTPKTRSSIRKVPISDDLVVALAEHPRDSIYVFPGKSPDKPIGDIRDAFRTAVKKADIRRNGKPLAVTPHTLRKATATWLAIDCGVPQRVLQSILGHAPGSAVTDRYYVSASDDAKRNAMSGISL